VSFAIHFALSNLGIPTPVEENPLVAVPAVLEELKVDFGAPKKDVMLASVFDFLASAGEDEERLLALRFSDPPIGKDIAMMDWIEWR
jgi:hypothetical protein